MRERRERLDIAEALILVGASFLLLPLAGGYLQARLGLGGVAVSELLLVLAPSLWALAVTRIDLRTGIGLVVPSPRALAGAVLAAVGAFYVVAAGLESLQERVAPLPPMLREELRQLLIPPGGKRPLAFDLFALAILPAICEELLFRGVMLRALLPVGKVPALLFTSLAFGAFHFSLYKVLPTATLGLLLGLLALRSRSLVPSMLAHAINNTLVVVLFRAGWEDPPGADSRAGPLLLAGAAAILLVGLLVTAPPKSRS